MRRRHQLQTRSRGERPHVMPFLCRRKLLLELSVRFALRQPNWSSVIALSLLLFNFSAAGQKSESGEDEETREAVVRYQVKNCKRKMSQVFTSKTGEPRKEELSSIKERLIT